MGRRGSRGRGSRKQSSTTTETDITTMNTNADQAQPDQQELDRQMTAIRARLAAMNARPAPPPPPPAHPLAAAELRPAGPPIDTDALADSVLDALARRAERARVGKRAHERMGGPCRFCGCRQSSNYFVEGERHVFWVDPTMCAQCQDDRWYTPGLDRADSQHKAIIVGRLVTGDWNSCKYPLDCYAFIERIGFKWFSESGAAPSPNFGERFAYVDLPALRELVDPYQPAIPWHSSKVHVWGEQCPTCGADEWVFEPGGAMGAGQRYCNRCAAAGVAGGLRLVRHVGGA